MNQVILCLFASVIAMLVVGSSVWSMECGTRGDGSKSYRYSKGDERNKGYRGSKGDGSEGNHESKGVGRMDYNGSKGDGYSKGDESNKGYRYSKGGGSEGNHSNKGSEGYGYSKGDERMGYRYSKGDGGEEYRSSNGDENCREVENIGTAVWCGSYERLQECSATGFDECEERKSSSGLKGCLIDDCTGKNDDNSPAPMRTKMVATCCKVPPEEFSIYY